MFCTNCGYQLPLEAKLCPACGAPVLLSNIATESTGSQSNEDVASKNIYRLIFQRKNQFYAVNPPMIVSIDGEERLSVENGAEAFIELHEGQHHIVITSSIRKKEFDVLLKNDTAISLGWNRFTGSIQAEICE